MFKSKNVLLSIGVLSVCCMVGFANATPRSAASNSSSKATQTSKAVSKSKAKRAPNRASAKAAPRRRLTAAQRARNAAALRARNARRQAAAPVVIVKTAVVVPPPVVRTTPAPAPVQPAVVQVVDKNDRMICKQEDILGTRLKSMRTCRKASEWRRISRGFQAKLKDTTDRGGAVYTGE